MCTFYSDKLKTQNSKLKTQNSKLKTQNFSRFLGLFTSFCLFFFNNSFAQTPDAVRTKLDFIHALLDKSQIPTGYLWDNGYAFVRPERFNGAIQDSNAVDITTWRFAYLSMTSGHSFGTNTLPNLATINQTLKPFESAATDTLALPILYLRYASFKPGDQLKDVSNRPTSPYQTQTLFGIAPTRTYTATGRASFVFRSDMFYSNAGLTVSMLQADLGDGLGWRTMAWDVPADVTYNSIGNKILKYRLTFSNGTVQEGKSDFYVRQAQALTAQRYENGAVDNTTIGFIPANFATNQAAGLVSIVRSVRNRDTNRITRPLIVAEGYDVSRVAPAMQTDYTIFDLIFEWSRLVTNGVTNQTFSQLLDDIGEYDLIFINYFRGTDDIRRNARLFEETVRRVNALKTPHFGVMQQNVVIGISMGGLVTRYGLAEMTRNGENTQTRLLITQDSPHRGANVPLGGQALLRMLAEMPLPLNNSLIELVPALQDGLNVLAEPASEQLLILRATNTNNGVASSAFLADGGEYRTMVDNVPNPQYQVIGTSLGAECGQPLQTPYFVMTWAGMNTSVGIPFVLLPLWMVAAQWTMKMEARALPDGGAPQRISYLSLERNWRIFGIKTFQAFLYNNSYYSPANVIPWDGAPAGVYNIDVPDGIPTSANIDVNLIGLATIKGAGVFNITRFSYIPTVSGLDIQQINRQSVFASYSAGVSGYVSRLRNFIAQEPITGTEFNQSHPFFIARQARWLFDQMQDTTTAGVNNCSANCAPVLAIDGSGVVCNTETYAVAGASDGTTYFWTVSNGLIISSGQGTPQITVSKNRRFQGNVTITVSLGNCPNATVTRQVWVGVPSTPAGPIWLNWSIPNTNSPDIYVCPNEWVGFNLPNAQFGYQGITRYDWAFSCGTKENEPNNGSSMTAQIDNGQAPCGDVRVRAVNACGESDWLIVNTEYGGNCMNLYSMRQNTEVFANPSDAETNVQIKNLPNVNYDQNNENTPAGFDYEIKVYNKQGSLVKTLTSDKVQKKIITSDLPKGQYQIIVTRGNIVVQKHLIVNR
jgi:hypothetical protein